MFREKINLEKIITSEQELVINLIQYFKNQGFKIKTEVPNMGQSIDIVAQKGRWVYAIEAKMNNWQRAIDQCKAHELISDFMYIALCTAGISESLINAAKSKGYGIIHCDPYSGNVTIYLQAKLNDKIWKPQKRIFFSKMREINYEN